MEHVFRLRSLTQIPLPVDLIGRHDSALHGQGLTGMLHCEFGTMTDFTRLQEWSNDFAVEQHEFS